MGQHTLPMSGLCVFGSDLCHFTTGSSIVYFWGYCKDNKKSFGVIIKVFIVMYSGNVSLSSVRLSLSGLLTLWVLGSAGIALSLKVCSDCPLKFFWGGGGGGGGCSLVG